MTNELSSTNAVNGSVNDAPIDGDVAPKKKRSPLRWTAIAALVIGGGFAAHAASGLDEATIQAAMSDAGIFGFALFLVAFVVGQTLQLPGMPFVLAARVAYGPVLGFAASYLAAILAVSAVFLVVRGLGGDALTRLKWSWAKKAMAKVEKKPLLTVIGLRAVFALSPPLNYALALSPVRFRQHMTGSAVGLLVPISIWVFLSDALVGWFA
ncbi:MAG: putative membrane protein YdjX (TVP38/TMEM64 family) [Polyangiales bacterium]|jgi:uncharacterized membrane protein YdjX (TVP38/TMEM64 family)